MCLEQPVGSGRTTQIQRQKTTDANGMVAHSRNGIKVPQWKLRRSSNREGRQNADYNSRNWSDKERDPAACSQSARQGGP
jgi:hypothetical protein